MQRHGHVVFFLLYLVVFHSALFLYLFECHRILWCHATRCPPIGFNSTFPRIEIVMHTRGYVGCISDHMRDQITHNSSFRGLLQECKELHPSFNWTAKYDVLLACQAFDFFHWYPVKMRLGWGHLHWILSRHATRNLKSWGSFQEVGLYRTHAMLIMYNAYIYKSMKVMGCDN